MAEIVKKYLDLEGLGKLKTALDGRYMLKNQGTQVGAAFVKVGSDADGRVVIGNGVAKSDITALGIPGADTNQKIKGNGTGFGDNDAVDIVAGGNISVTADTTNKKITIAYTGAAGNDNQKVKSGTSTFGDNAVVNIKADGESGNPITVSAVTTSGSEAINIKHGTAEEAVAAAVKVGRDAWGHVVLGTPLQYSDIGGTPTIGDGTLTIQANGTSKGTFKANATGNTTVNITAADLGLDSALKFKGVYDTLPVVTNFSVGDVIIVKSTGKEYVCAEISGTKQWVELGDEGSYALKTTTISAGTGLTGGGSLAANRTISLAEYGTAAAAAAVKVGADAYGRVILGDKLSNSSVDNHTHTVDSTGSITPSLTVTSTAYGNTTSADTFVKSYPGVFLTLDKMTVNKAVAVSSKPTRTVLGTATTASKVSITGKKASKATAGEQLVYGNANLKSGTTDVIGSATGTFVTGASLTGTKTFNTDAVKMHMGTAAASEDTECLYIEAAGTGTVGISAPTGSVATTTKTIQEAATSTSKFTPYTFADVDCSLVSADDVTVPVISSNAEINCAVLDGTYTVGAGTASSTGQGTSIMTGLGTAVTADALTGATFGTKTGGITLVSAVAGKSQSVSVSGTTSAEGGHTHTIS